MFEGITSLNSNIDLDKQGSKEDPRKKSESWKVIDSYKEELDKAYTEEYASLDEYQKSIVDLPTTNPVKVIANAGCIDGSSVIQVRRGKADHRVTIEEEYNRLKRIKGVKRRREALDKLKVHALTENYIEFHKVINIVQSGKKPVWELKLKDDSVLIATPDHKIYTDKGWVPLEELTSEHSVAMDRTDYSPIPDRKNKYKNSSYVPVEYVKDLNEIRMTYDIQCEDPYHNFVANNMVIHNSGKTKTLISRSLRLVLKERVTPSSIVLITFTNKAAKEIQERYFQFFEKVVGRKADKIDLPQMSTMHSMGIKLLHKRFGVHKSILNEYTNFISIKKAIEDCRLDKTVAVDNDEVMRVMESISKLYSMGEMHFVAYPVFDKKGNLLQILTYEEAMRDEKHREVLNTLTLTSETFVGCQIEDNTRYEKKDIENLIPPEAVSGVLGNAADMAGMTNSGFRNVLNSYMNVKYRTNVMSFDDCIWIPQLLAHQHPDHTKALEDHYDHIMCDESQDIDSNQWGLLHTLSGINSGKIPKLVLVGDPKQTLYSWRYCNPDVLSNLDLLLNTENIETFSGSILSNYRSPKPLVELSNIFAESFRRFDVEPSNPFHPPSKGCLEVLHFDNSFLECKYLSQEINRLRDQQEVPLGKISVLARTNKSLQDLESALISGRIPYVLKYDRRSAVRQSSFKFTYSIYSLLVSGKDITSMCEILQSIKGLGPKYIEHFREFYLAKLHVNPTFTLWDINESNYPCKTKQDSLFIGFLHDVLNPLYQYYKETYNVSFLELNAKLKNILYRSVKFAEGTNSGSKDYSVAIAESSFFKTMVTFNNIYQTLMEEQDFKRMNNTERFLEMFHTLQLSQEEVSDKKDRVMVSTIHAFKGKENDYVFFSSINRLNTGSNSDDRFEDERCAFYVAVTRAKKKLYLLASEEVLDYKGCLRKAIPNRYLIEYMNGMKELANRSE